MGKDKKKPKLAIKTARYFTKTCSCGFEYPNWFVSCPKCGTPWDNVEAQKAKAAPEEEPSKTKTIKIVVKITEEDFDEDIQNVQLIFSADQGKMWYQMKMDVKMDYFIAEIAEVPIGSVIVYYIEVYLVNADKVVENNEGKYFFYQVGTPISEVTPEPTSTETTEIKEEISESLPTLPETSEPEGKVVKAPEDDNITIFGRPQTQVDPDLKDCPHCNSKIKKMWSICPICGGKV